MRYDIRYLRKHRGWPDLPKPLWQKIKRFLDEKSDSFRVEYDYKAVEVKPDVEFGSGFQHLPIRIRGLSVYPMAAVQN
jgi:hypothetical protein